MTTRLLAILSTILFVAITVYTAPLDPGVNRIQFTFSEADFQAILGQWQASGIAIFKGHFVLDFPFLLSYGALGYQLSTRTGLLRSFTPPIRQRLALLLPLAALGDAIENGLQLFFLYAPAPIAGGLYLTAGIVSSSKWLLITLFIGAASLGLFGKREHRMR